MKFSLKILFLFIPVVSLFADPPEGWNYAIEDKVAYDSQKCMFRYDDLRNSGTQPRWNADITFENHGPNQKAVDAHLARLKSVELPKVPKNGRFFVVDHVACNRSGIGCQQSQMLFDEVASRTGYPVLGRNTPAGHLAYSNSGVIDTETYNMLQKIRANDPNEYQRIKLDYAKRWSEGTQKQFRLPVLDRHFVPKTPRIPTGTWRGCPTAKGVVSPQLPGANCGCFSKLANGLKSTASAAKSWARSGASKIGRAIGPIGILPNITAPLGKTSRKLSAQIDAGCEPDGFFETLGETIQEEIEDFYYNFNNPFEIGDMI